MDLKNERACNVPCPTLGGTEFRCAGSKGDTTRVGLSFVEGGNGSGGALATSR